MKSFTKILFTGIVLLMSSSLLWSQMITLSGSAPVDYVPATRGVLYEQLPEPGGTAFASQEFGDEPDFTCEAADDFVVPTTWTIQSVTVWGTRWNPPTPSSTNIVNVNFYADNPGIARAGVPADIALYSFPAIAATNSGILPSIVYTITFPVPVILAPGTYWLGVAEVADFGTSGQFGRVRATPVTNTMFYWRNPNGGFGHGSSWVPGTTISSTPYDLSFRLEGSEGVDRCDGIVSLVGEFNNWGIDGDFNLTQDPVDPDIWTGTIALTNAMNLHDDPDIIEVKFRLNADWTINWGAADFPSGIGVQDGPNIPVPIGLDAPVDEYFITFNCRTGEYSFKNLRFIPISNWALYLGIILMITFVIIRFRRIV